MGNSQTNKDSIPKTDNSPSEPPPESSIQQPNQQNPNLPNSLKINRKHSGQFATPPDLSPNNFSPNLPRIDSGLINFQNQRNQDEIFEKEDLIDNELIQNQLIDSEKDLTKYNLKENLQLNFHPHKRYFHLSKAENTSMPIMVSIKTIQAQKSAKSTFQKVPIDLFMVIDASGSMGDDGKEALVKKSINYLLSILTENDRICLITFNNSAVFITPLLRVNAINVALIQKDLSCIHSNGGTNIEAGIEKAFTMMNQRKTKNIVSCIFLLSDGEDNNSENLISRLNILKQKNKPKDDYILNTYGYGKEHDSKIMQAIAKDNNGNAYYIEDYSKVDEYFVLSLSGLLTIVAKNIELVVEKQICLNKNIPKFKIGKLYGGENIWKPIDNSQNSFKITLANMLAGVSKDYLLDIEFEKLDNNLMDNEKQVNVLTAQFKCTNILTNNDIFKKNASLDLNLLNPLEEVKLNKFKLIFFKIKENEIDKEVELNYLRVKAAEKIAVACSLAEKGENDKAEEELEKMIEELEISSLVDERIIQVLIKDCFKSKDLCKKGEFQDKGFAFMNKKIHQHVERVSSACEILYANEFQEEMMGDLFDSK